MYALAAQSAGTNWVVLILVYVVIFGGFYMLFIVEFGNNKNCRIPMQKAAIAQVEKASAE